MSEKGSEPDIEARRFNVAEVPDSDITEPTSRVIQLPGGLRLRGVMRLARIAGPIGK
jgi:hypothetical protein